MFASPNFGIAHNLCNGMQCQHRLVELGDNFVIWYLEARQSTSNTNVI